MTKRENFLVFGAPEIQQAEIDEVVDSLKTGWLGTGPKVARFEQDFWRYKGGWGHPVAVNSCTAALHLSLVAAGIGRGDEVITTPMTFCATTNTILHAGATPVIADVDPVTFNIEADSIEAKITAKTKAILPVHFAGRPCKIDDIIDLAERHNLTVIEDCAHAVESEFHGRAAGTFGDFGCFSFNVTKNVVTGEGGLILARNAKAAGRIKMLALHGMSKDAWERFSNDGYKHYEVVECGYKYNMMDLQAALGIHQLNRVEQSWLRRKQIWESYDRAFASMPLTTPAPPASNTKHAYHLYTLLLVDENEAGIGRDQMLDELTMRNIGAGVHYRCLAEHPYYQKKLGWKPDDCLNATNIGRQTISLPLTQTMSDEDIANVINAVKEIVAK